MPKGELMNLSHLYYFRKLVEVGNYSDAADELFIAQPTLSLAVSSLEKELGAPLLKKKRNGVELTEDGEEFYTATLTATNALDSSIASIKQRAANEYDSIRLGAVYSIQSPEWSRLISQFRRTVDSRLHIDVRQGTTSSLFRDLKAGEVDLIFSGIPLGGDSEVTSIPCFTQGITLVVNQDSPLAARDKISLDELSGLRQQVISYTLKGGPFETELKQLLENYPRLNVRCNYSDEITLCSLVVADPGIVALACHSWLVSTFPNVRTVELEDAPKDFHQFYMSYRKRGRKALAVEAFLDMAKNYDFINVSPSYKEEEGVAAQEGASVGDASAEGAAAKNATVQGAADEGEPGVATKAAGGVKAEDSAAKPVSAATEKVADSAAKVADDVAAKVAD